MAKRYLLFFLLNRPLNIVYYDLWWVCFAWIKIRSKYTMFSLSLGGKKMQTKHFIKVTWTLIYMLPLYTLTIWIWIKRFRKKYSQCLFACLSCLDNHFMAISYTDKNAKLLSNYLEQSQKICLISSILTNDFAPVVQLMMDRGTEKIP